MPLIYHHSSPPGWVLLITLIINNRQSPFRCTCKLPCISPSIVGGDSGELVAEGCQHFILHPLQLYSILFPNPFIVNRILYSIFFILYLVPITLSLLSNKTRHCFSSWLSSKWYIFIISCILFMVEIDEEAFAIIFVVTMNQRSKNANQQMIKKQHPRIRARDLCENINTSSCTRYLLVLVTPLLSRKNEYTMTLCKCCRLSPYRLL